MERPDTVISAALEQPHVARLAQVIFGEASAAAVASQIETFAQTNLQASIERWEFVAGGAASTHGLRLDDGRRLVLKIHPRGSVAQTRLHAAAEVQSHLNHTGFPCPSPVLGPTRLGGGVATVESFLSEGNRGDPADPILPSRMGQAFADLVGRCDEFVSMEALDAERLGRYPIEPLWPAPHDPRLDFGREASSARWIDALAGEARRRRYSTPLGPYVVGHNDWRVEHVHFAKGHVVAVHDWDSLVRTRESLLVASAIRGFTADWSTHEAPVVPTIEEAHAFVEAYERTRGRVFDAAERALMYALWVDATAYAARCEHARMHSTGGAEDGRDKAPPARDYRRRLARHGPALLGIEPPPGTPTYEED